MNNLNGYKSEDYFQAGPDIYPDEIFEDDLYVFETDDSRYYDILDAMNCLIPCQIWA